MSEQVERNVGGSDRESPGMDRLLKTGRIVCNVLLIFLLCVRMLSATTSSGLVNERNRISTALMVVCGLRLMFILVDFARGAIPWQRTLFPLLILLAIAATFGNHQLRQMVKILVLTVEAIGFLLVVFLAGRKSHNDNRPLEERLVERLQLFLPFTAARFVTLEILILYTVITRGERRSGALKGEFGYVETSIFPIIPLILIFAAPVDIALVEVLLRVLKFKGWFWSVFLIGTDVYAIIWVYGMQLIMKARPHKVSDGYLHIYKGLNKRANISLNHIKSMTVFSREQRKKRRDMGNFSIRGTSVIEIVLESPVQVLDWLSLKSHPVDSVLISADHPNALLQEIHSARMRGAVI